MDYLFINAIAWMPAAGGPMAFAPVNVYAKMLGEADPDFYARCEAGLRRRLNKVDEPWSVIALSDMEDLKRNRATHRRDGKGFRNCWELVNGTVIVNLGKARAQMLGHYRIERDRLLAESDKETLRLEDQPGTAIQKQNQRTYRQALRDLPAAIEVQLNAAQAIVALEAFNPSWPVRS